MCYKNKACLKSDLTNNQKKGGCNKRQIIPINPTFFRVLWAFYFHNPSNVQKQRLSTK